MITPSFFSVSQLWPDFSTRYDRYSSMSLNGMHSAMPSLSASCLAIHQPGFWSCGGGTTGCRSDVQPMRPKPISSSSWRSRKVVSGRIDVGVAGDLARDRVADDQQVELVDRLQRLLLVRQRLHQVGRVDEPALDRVRLAGERRVADAGGDAFVGERVLHGVGAVGARLVRLRVARAAGRARSSCPAATNRPPLRPQLPSSAGQQRDRAAALRVVAVPVDAPARVDDRGRPVAGELARRGADQLGRDARLLRPPTRRV